MSEHVLSTNTPNGLRPQSAPGLAGPENAASRRSVFGTASPSGSRGLQRRLHDIRWRLLGVALLGCLAAVADGLLAIGTRGEGQAWLRAAIVAGLIGAGALAFTLRGRQRMGVLLLAGGVVSALWMLNGASAPLPFSVGVLFTGFGPWVCAYLSLAYPTGRLRSQAERTFLALTGCGSLLWLLAILTQAQPPFRTPLASCTPHCPHSEFFTGVTLGAAAPVLHVLLLLGWMLIASGTPLLIASRARSAPTPVRRSLSPIELVSVANALCLLAYVAAITAGWSLDRQLGSGYAVLVLAIPFAMVLGLALERLSMGRALAAFIDDLAREPRADPQTLMATALSDPSLQIAYQPSGASGYVDLSGTPVATPRPDPDRALTWIERADQPAAVISYDAALADQEPFVEAAGAAALMHLEERKLESELRASAAELDASRTRLRASTAELAASRTRLVETAYTERRRIERDLHDSVQQDLVGLRIKLDMIAEKVYEDPSSATRMITSLGLQMDHVLEALRSLARGIYPAVLSERGLGEALKSAARRCAVPVTVDAREIGRYPQDVEVAVYFCCLEALQNVAKHAGPDATASIRLRQLKSQLIVDVRDTGGGFDPSRADGNHGLRNMRDRIEAVGGALVIASRPTGTSIRAVVPTAGTDAGPRELEPNQSL